MKSLCIADEKHPAWDINIPADCSMGHFRVDPDVNTNIFELERSATPVISPEFVPAAEKLKAGI